MCGPCRLSVSSGESNIIVDCTAGYRRTNRLPEVLPECQPTCSSLAISPAPRPRSRLTSMASASSCCRRDRGPPAAGAIGRPNACLVAACARSPTCPGPACPCGCGGRGGATSVRRPGARVGPSVRGSAGMRRVSLALLQLGLALADRPALSSRPSSACRRVRRCCSASCASWPAPIPSPDGPSASTIGRGSDGSDIVLPSAGQCWGAPGARQERRGAEHPNRGNGRRHVRSFREARCHICIHVYLGQPAASASYLVRLQLIAGDRPLLLAKIGLDSRRNGQAQRALALAWQLRIAFASGRARAFVFARTDGWHRGDHNIDVWDFSLTDRARRPKFFTAACCRSLQGSGVRWHERC
jgi:hypothetical protein